MNKQKLFLCNFITTSLDFSILILLKLAKGLILQLVLNEALTIINMDLISEHSAKLPTLTEHDVSEKVISRHIKILKNAIIKINSNP